MLVARILLHATMIILGCHFVDRVLAGQWVPLAHLVLDWIRPGQFLPFGVALACALNRRPAFLAAIFTVALLLSYHQIKNELLSMGIAALLGLGMAQLVLVLVNERAPGEEE